MTNPTTFISYAWENDELKEWVKDLAIQLRNIGIDAKIDQWELLPGDQITHFMEKSVRDNDYILIICTPKYKQKSENRIGGVGYEGDIMTSEVLQTANHQKFIPILKSGTKETSLPTWLQGKYFVDLSTHQNFIRNFEDLKTTILNIREKAPGLGIIQHKPEKAVTNNDSISSDNEDIRIRGILVDEVTQPLNNGTAGSGLYKIPFELNKLPSYEWISLFIGAWNNPRSLSLMHRRGIASVSGKKIILNGTTIEEVERYHKDTLKLAIEDANSTLKAERTRKRQIEELERRKREEHQKTIEEVSKRISF